MIKVIARKFRAANPGWSAREYGPRLSVLAELDALDPGHHVPARRAIDEDPRHVALDLLASSVQVGACRSACSVGLGPSNSFGGSSGSSAIASCVAADLTSDTAGGVMVCDLAQER
jgi:hypothetical protein